jgi:SGNH hydrolase-like domain, acetyltransferase AlgX
MQVANLIKTGVGVLVGGLMTLLIAEGGLRLLPVSTGLRLAQTSGTFPIQKGFPRDEYTYSHGWNFFNAQHGKLNNYGFVDEIDYAPGSHPIVIIGDSFVEALMLSGKETIQARLRQRLSPDVGSYGVGISGAGLSDYLVMARYAKQEFAPRALVVLVVAGDVKDSLIAHSGGYFFGKGARGELQLMRSPTGQHRELWAMLAHSRLFLYFVQNLRFSPARLIAGLDRLNASLRAHAVAAPDQMEQRVIDVFLHDLAEFSGLPAHRIALVFDADRENIYAQQPNSRSTADAEQREAFMNAARERGYVIVDLAPVFSRYYHTFGQRLDFSPYDMHWNPLAHEIAAREVAAALAKGAGITPVAARR